MIPEFLYRPARDDDYGFVLNSWLKSYYNTAIIKPHINRGIFFRNEAKIVNKLIREDSITIACNPEDDTHIFGYICYRVDPQVMHYVYMKQPFRRIGIAGGLLSSSLSGKDIDVTYHTPRLKRLNNWYKFTYNPYLKEKL